MAWREPSCTPKHQTCNALWMVLWAGVCGSCVVNTGQKKWYPTKHGKKGETNTKKRLPNQGLPRTYSKDPNLTKFKFALWESGSERDFCFFFMSTCLYTFYSVLHLNQYNPMQLHRTCDPAVSIMAGRSVDRFPSQQCWSDLISLCKSCVCVCVCVCVFSTPGTNFTYLAATAVRIAVTNAVIIIIAGCSISPITLMSTCGLVFYHS